MQLAKRACTAQSKQGFDTGAELSQRAFWQVAEVFQRALRIQGTKVGVWSFGNTALGRRGARAENFGDDMGVGGDSSCYNLNTFYFSGLRLEELCPGLHWG